MMTPSEIALAIVFAAIALGMIWLASRTPQRAPMYDLTRWAGPDAALEAYQSKIDMLAEESPEFMDHLARRHERGELVKAGIVGEVEP